MPHHCFRLFLPHSTRLILLLGMLGASAFIALGVAHPAGAGTRSADCAGIEQTGIDGTAQKTPMIQVTVENVIDSNGLITAVLYSDDSENFLKRGSRLDRIRVEATEGQTILCLQAPRPGRFAIALYHDQNGNKEFDRNFLGIPTEGYGFSRNPGFRLGKPDVDEILFSTEGELTRLKISIRYL